MTDGTVERTDETCSNCGAPLLKVTPAETPEGVPDSAYICDPEEGCGMVDRYE